MVGTTRARETTLVYASINFSKWLFYCGLSKLQRNSDAPIKVIIEMIDEGGGGCW